MDKTAIITFATTMFTILNPIGNVAIFAAMVTGRPAHARTRTALKCAIAVAIILVATVWAGEATLRLFGVEIPGLQTAGGLMIAFIALSMLHSRQSPIHDTADSGAGAQNDQDIAIVPLAMPMIAGPGAMVTVIVNTHQHQGISANVAMSVVCVALAALIGAGFLASGAITRVLGATGMDIVTKLMGMVLLALAASMLAAGMKGLLPGLSG